MPEVYTKDPGNQLLGTYLGVVYVPQADSEYEFPYGLHIAFVDPSSEPGMMHANKVILSQINLEVALDEPRIES